MTVRRTYHADLVGYIWQPGVGLCATESNFEADDHDHARDIINMTGDFQSIEDYRLVETMHFHAIDITRVVHDWEDEDNEFVFSDCMYPCDDWE